LTSSESRRTGFNHEFEFVRLFMIRESPMNHRLIDDRRHYRAKRFNSIAATRQNLAANSPAKLLVAINCTSRRTTFK